MFYFKKIYIIIGLKLGIIIDYHKTLLLLSII